MSDELNFAPANEVVEYNIWRWQIMGDDPDMHNGETEVQYLARLQTGWAYVPSPFMREMERRMKNKRYDKPDDRET